MSTWFLGLLQITDGSFPSGAFSHSFGLETAIDEGRVRDLATLVVWLRTYLGGTLEPSDLRAIAIVRAGIERIEDVDATLAAMQYTQEIRAAQRRMTLATLDAYGAAALASRELARYRAAVRAGNAAGHPAVALGLASHAIGAPLPATLEAYGAATLGALASAAARAIPLGQRDVQRARWSLQNAVTASATYAAGARRCDELAAWAFFQEIDALRHRGLPGRLFAS